MLKIRINHTHLSQIKKTKRKNHKKAEESENIQTQECRIE